jgi:hypothetical protein
VRAQHQALPGFLLWPMWFNKTRRFQFEVMQFRQALASPEDKKNFGQST